MEEFEHHQTARGRAFLWGGAAAGLLLIVLLFTHGFGLFAAHPSATEVTGLIHQGDRVLVPEGSVLRQRLVVAAATSEPVSDRLVLPGIVESNPARTAAVLPALAGRVSELRVALGDRVSRGQVLAVIDSPDLGQALDDDDKAADALRFTEKNLERQEGQVKLGAASDRDLDQARSDHAQALAEYTRTRARLKAIGVSDESDRRSRLLTVRAPIAGTVTSLAVAPGNMVNDPTQPLMSIADLATVWVTALVPEEDVGAVTRNQDAEVSLVAYPDRTLRGKVLFVSDVVEPDSRRDKVRIAFSNPGYALKPNMFATVTLLAAGRTRVVLPTSALLMNNDRTSVFVAVAPWTFERRIVEPQLEEGGTVAIDAGIKPGEQVVVKGGILLND
jgi:cobalt-zinc-cadmium efflux system membrane fusion protein